MLLTETQRTILKLPENATAVLIFFLAHKTPETLQDKTVYQAVDFEMLGDHSADYLQTGLQELFKTSTCIQHETRAVTFSILEAYELNEDFSVATIQFSNLFATWFLATSPAQI